MVMMIESARLNVLPPIARQQVRELQERYSDNHLLSQSASKRLQQVEARLGPLEVRFMSNDGKMSDEEAEQLRRLREDARISRERVNALVQRSREDAQIFAAVDQWLSHPSRIFLHMQEPTVEIYDVPLPKAEGDLNEIRRQIGALNLERQHLLRSPMSREECEAAVSSYVGKLAHDAEPVIRGLNGREPFSIDTRNARPLSLLAWYDPQALTARIMQSIPTTIGNLTKAEKEARLAEIEREVLRLERIEEALVRATPGTERRPGADVRAILSVDERPRSEAMAA